MFKLGAYVDEADEDEVFEEDIDDKESRIDSFLKRKLGRERHTKRNRGPSPKIRSGKPVPQSGWDDENLYDDDFSDIIDVWDVN